MNLVLAIMCIAAIAAIVAALYWPTAARWVAAMLLARAHYLDNIRSDRDLRLAQAHSFRRNLEREYGIAE